MDIKRHATAIWEGTGKEGKGTVTTQSEVLHGSQYSYKTRFEDGKGTNPEELIAAAHAGCFSMALSFALAGAGHTAEHIDTKCTVTLADGSITRSELEVKAKVPGLDKAKFEELAKGAKENCPISKLFKAEIHMHAELMA